MKERLQKIIAAAGITSRRNAEKLIVEGRVTVNRVVVRELGVKADIEKDEIRVDDKLIYLEVSKIYLMLHKPRGYVTTLNDPQGRPIVTNLLSGIEERVFPVGRLDYDSEGLLLLTNDGDFAQRLQHPRFSIPKTYEVKIKGNFKEQDIKLLIKGVSLDDGKFMPDHVQLIKRGPKSTWLTLTISEGRNRLIRRSIEALDHDVVRLVRVAVSDLQLGTLKAGQYRHLTKEEVKKILSFSK